jgi:hypothetical protein
MTKPMQRSYLLRLWRDHARAPMRATLIAVECPDKPRPFASMDELFAFLNRRAYSVKLATIERNGMAIIVHPSATRACSAWGARRSLR